MVAEAEMVCIALRYDTVMSRAFLRALEYQGAHPRTRGRKAHHGGTCARKMERRKYAGMMQCFRNPTSPMDWH